MKIKIKKELPLCIALFLITMSWSNYIIDLGLSTSFEYIGLWLAKLGKYLASVSSNIFSAPLSLSSLPDKDRSLGKGTGPRGSVYFFPVYFLSNVQTG